MLFSEDFMLESMAKGAMAGILICYCINGIGAFDDLVKYTKLNHDLLVQISVNTAR